MTENMKLSIIIVSWNVKDLLKKCLESIENWKEDLLLEIIVVDNNSIDGTQEMLKSLTRNDYQYFCGRRNIENKFKFILNKTNLGFAQGNNIGLKYTKGEYILFLNPDTEITKWSLQSMVEFMENNSKCGALGPKLLNQDSSLQLSVRKFPTLISQLLILIKIHNFFPKLKPLKNYFQLNFNYEKEQEVDQVMGAGLMIKKSIIEKIQITPSSSPLHKRENKLFDPKFRRIFEEVDLCYRIKKAGYKIYYTPNAQIIHHKGSSFAKSKIFQKQLDFNQGMRRFFWKHKPRWQYFIISIFQPINWSIAFIQVILAQLGDPIRKKFKKKVL